jgi:hypothetical protein
VLGELPPPPPLEQAVKAIRQIKGGTPSALFHAVSIKCP